MISYHCIFRFSADWVGTFEMNECEATNLQIEQEWINSKGIHILYKVQVVSDDIYIEVAPVKP